jgi:hypothetical protein
MQRAASTVVRPHTASTIAAWRSYAASWLRLAILAIVTRLPYGMNRRAAHERRKSRGNRICHRRVAWLYLDGSLRASSRSAGTAIWIFMMICGGMGSLAGLVWEWVVR